MSTATRGARKPPELAGAAFSPGLLSYAPPLNEFSGAAPLGPSQLAIVASFPFIVCGADDVRRLLVRRQGGKYDHEPITHRG